MSSCTALGTLQLIVKIMSGMIDGSFMLIPLTDCLLACRYKYSFPFLGGDDDELAGAISVDDNRVGPLYKHVFPPILAPHISFIGLPFRVGQSTPSVNLILRQLGN